MKLINRISLVVTTCLAVACAFVASARLPVSLATPATDAPVYSVKAFGATGDGKTLDTSAINKAIDGAALAGGGTVYFPAGNDLSVSIHLESNIALYLDQGATIIAAN